jgi:hypothetical protein
MKLEAPVRRVIGKTRYYLATIVDGTVVPMEEIPSPVKVEIEEDVETGGFFLFHYDAAGECLADDWFETLEQAKRHGKEQFDIGEGDWAALE